VRLSIFQRCLLSTVTVTPSDLDYVNRSASIQRFRSIHTTRSWRSRVRFFVFVPRGTCTPGSRCTKSLETVATRVVNSISHKIVLFCERYWLAGVWCLCYVWWRTLLLINCSGIELVLCDFKLYLTRFVLAKSLLSDTFFIVFFHKLYRCDWWVFEFGLLSIQWIGKPNKAFKSNALHTRFVFLKHNVLQARFFGEKNVLQARLTWENAPQARLLWLNLDGYSVLLM